MIVKTVWVTESKWQETQKSLRKRMLKILPRNRIVGRQVGNIQSDLRARGESILSRAFGNAIERKEVKTKNGRKQSKM